MITSHHQNPARFQREQSRYSDQLQPSQPLRGWSHDLIDLAIAAATVAFLWGVAALVSQPAPSQPRCETPPVQGMEGGQ